MTTMFASDTVTAPVEVEPEALTTYKALVRRKARAAKRQQGWPTAKMNAVLVELGLAPVETYAVEIPFTAKGVYRYEVGDGMDRTSAETTVAQIQRYTDTDIFSGSRATMEMVERTPAKLVVTGIDGVETAEEAKTHDLDAYKAFVRKVSIRVAAENGWCDSGTNEYLEAMDLAPIVPQYVTVEVPVMQRVQVLVREASTAEEARALVTSGGDDAERLLKNHLGAMVRITGPAAVPDAAANFHVRVGDMDPFYYGNFEPRHRCGTYSSGSSYMCTRDHHQAGGDANIHVASMSGGQVAAVWRGTDRPRDGRGDSTAAL